MTLSLVDVSLKVRFPTGKHITAISSVSLTVGIGERIGLIGRNGSGKSSLARIIAGLEKASHGLRISQPPISRTALALAKSEDHMIEATVRRQIWRHGTGEFTDREIDDLLDLVGLSPFYGDRNPLSLSTGEQRLVIIACMLATKSDLILFDEPMAGLDAINRKQVARAIRNSQASDKSVLLISHHPDDLLGLADRLLILENGSLQYDGSFAQVPYAMLTKALHPDDDSLVRMTRQLADAGITFPNSIFSSGDPEEISRLIANALA